MADLYAKKLESERKKLWATCRLKGLAKGTNTKIQLMKRQAYGFRDYEFFKLKILGIHETHHALVG